MPGSPAEWRISDRSFASKDELIQFDVFVGRRCPARDAVARTCRRSIVSQPPPMPFAARLWRFGKCFGPIFLAAFLLLSAPMVLSVG
jgi:hypothetical protein